MAGIKLSAAQYSIITADGKQLALAIVDSLLVLAKHSRLFNPRHRRSHLGADAGEFIRCRAAAGILRRYRRFIGMPHTHFNTNVVLEAMLNSNQLPVTFAIRNAVFRMNNLTEQSGLVAQLVRRLHTGFDTTLALRRAGINESIVGFSPVRRGVETLVFMLKFYTLAQPFFAVEAFGLNHFGNQHGLIGQFDCTIYADQLFDIVF